MEERLFTKTEKILYGYYKKREELYRKQKALETVEQNIADIRRILAEADDLIPSFGIVGKYQTVVGGTGGGSVSDPTERIYSEYVRTIEDFERELAQLIKRKIKLKMRIMTLQTEIEGIEFALGLLEEQEKKIAEQKYYYKRSNLQIGLALKMDESTVRYQRRLIVEKMARYLRVS